MGFDLIDYKMGVENLLMMQWGASMPEVLIELERFGFFDYILPFLLIFAVIFAILENIPVFQDKDKNPKRGPIMIISLAIGILALWSGIVPAFLSRILPNLGIGLSILLVALILTGAFLPADEKYKWIFFGLGAIIFLIATFDALSSWSFLGGWWWDRYLSVIIVLLVIIAAVVAVVVGSKAGTSSGSSH